MNLRRTTKYTKAGDVYFLNELDYCDPIAHSSTGTGWRLRRSPQVEGPVAEGAYSHFPRFSSLTFD
jgi:hypothetical protein